VRICCALAAKGERARARSREASESFMDLLRVDRRAALDTIPDAAL
jgi:hypothetical protein